MQAVLRKPVPGSLPERGELKAEMAEVCTGRAVLAARRQRAQGRAGLVRQVPPEEQLSAQEQEPAQPSRLEPFRNWRKKH